MRDTLFQDVIRRKVLFSSNNNTRKRKNLGATEGYMAKENNKNYYIKRFDQLEGRKSFTIKNIN